MKVKNILVENRNEFQELLIRELINNEISYVQIENEFHFLDKIYRFYDFDEISYIDFDRYLKFDSLDTVFNIIDISNLDNNCIGFYKEDNSNFSDKKIKYQTKKSIKYNNKSINQKIKRLNK